MASVLQAMGFEPADWGVLQHQGWEAFLQLRAARRKALLPWFWERGKQAEEEREEEERQRQQETEGRLQDAGPAETLATVVVEGAGGVVSVAEVPLSHVEAEAQEAWQQLQVRCRQAGDLPGRPGLLHT